MYNGTKIFCIFIYNIDMYTLKKDFVDFLYLNLNTQR